MRELILERRSKRERNGAVPDMDNTNMGGIQGTWRIKEGTSSSKTQTTDCEVNQKYDLPVANETIEEEPSEEVPDAVITDTSEVEVGQYYILIRSKAKDGNQKSVQHKGVEAMIEANETLIEAQVEVHQVALDAIMTETAKTSDPKETCLANSRVDVGMKPEIVNFREMDSMSKPSRPTWV